MWLRFLALLFAVAALIAAVAAGAAFLLGPTPALSEGPLVVEIPPQSGVMAIATHLSDAGAVHSAWIFVAVSAAQGSIRRLKPGEYEFPAGASTLAIARMIESGRVRQHPVLHPEGATMTELARALEAARLARAEDVLRVARDPAFLAAQGIEGRSVEGYLFPDTYQFVRGMKVEEMLGRMIHRMRAKLTPELLARAKARGFTAQQLLTLASIV